MAAVTQTRVPIMDETLSLSSQTTIQDNNLPELRSRIIIDLLTEASETTSHEIVEKSCKQAYELIICEVDTDTCNALNIQPPAYWYTLLAEYYRNNTDMAEVLLAYCRTMWGQENVVSIYSLLLHEWIIEDHTAGGRSERYKHINILLTGCKQLFWEDLIQGTHNFTKLYTFLHRSATENENHVLQFDDRGTNELLRKFWSHLSMAMPYYAPLRSIAQDVMNFIREERNGEKGERQFLPKSFFGYEEFFAEIAETLKWFNGCERGLKNYLLALGELGKFHLLKGNHQKRPTPAVRDAAFYVLDALYPNGATLRRMVSKLFNVLHPFNWYGSI